jgi:hypothetical protein
VPSTSVADPWLAVAGTPVMAMPENHILVANLL